MDYYASLFASKVSGGGGGITPQVKQALLACFSKVAWVDENGNDYYSTLQSALYDPADLSSVSAVYSGGSVTEGTSLDTLKSNLVVTASWSDSSTSTIGSAYYTLSGSLVAGASTITVTYLGKTTTFNVTVTDDGVADGVYTPQTITRGYYIDENGDVQSAGNQSAYIEDYIPVSYSKIRFLQWTFSGNPNVRISEYDSSKVFIKQTQYKDTFYDAYTPTDSNTKYIRLGWYGGTSYVPTFTFNKLIEANLVMEVGSIDSTSGADEVQPLRIRSKDYIPVEDRITLEGCPFASSWSGWGLGYAFRCYDVNKSFTGSVLKNNGLFNSDCQSVSLPSNTKYVRIFMQKSSSYQFSPGFTQDAVNTMTINNHIYTLTEE